MNQHSTIRALLLARLEHQLSTGQQRDLENHLQTCSSCSRYHETLTKFLEPGQEAPSPVLSPDPYLPTRIAALSGHAISNEQLRDHRALRWARTSVAFLLAIAFGIYIGESLSTRSVNLTEQRIITEYSETLDVGGIGDRLQTVAAATGEVSQ